MHGRWDYDDDTDGVDAQKEFGKRPSSDGKVTGKSPVPEVPSNQEVVVKTDADQKGTRGGSGDAPALDGEVKDMENISVHWNTKGQVVFSDSQQRTQGPSSRSYY